MGRDETEGEMSYERGRTSLWTGQSERERERERESERENERETEKRGGTGTWMGMRPMISMVATVNQ